MAASQIIVDACEGAETTVVSGLSAGAVCNDMWDFVFLMSLFAMGWVIFRPEVLRALLGPKLTPRVRQRQSPQLSMAGSKQPQEAPADDGQHKESACSAISPQPAIDVPSPAPSAASTVAPDPDLLCFTAWAMAQSPAGSEVESILLELEGFVDGRSSFSPTIGCNSEGEGYEGSYGGVEAVEAKIISLAAVHDLDGCWQAWQRLPECTALGGCACCALAEALREAAAEPDDADSALQVALASHSVPLAEAALAAGSQLMSSTWLERAGVRLHVAGMGPLPEHATSLACAYGREGRADKAVQVWQEACAGHDPVFFTEDDAPKCPRAPELYAAALGACVACDDFILARRIAQAVEWLAPPAAAGQGAQLKLAIWLAQQQEVTLAYQCAVSVQRVSGVLDMTTFRALLSACARSANMKLAETIFSDATSRGLAPDKTTLSIMIQGYSAVGDAERAASFFHLMRRRGMVPEVQVYDSVMDGCASRNLWDQAEQILSDMLAVGLRPSGATVAILIRIHSARGELERAVEVFRELPRKHGLELDGRARSALVFACLANGNIRLAVESFEEMTLAGCLASARMYEALIEGCFRRGDLDRAASLVEEAMGLRPGDAASSGVPHENGIALTHRRMILERRVVEELLRLIGQRRQARRLGVPLAARLVAAGFEISEDLLGGLAHAAERDLATARHSPLEARRADWCCWRDYIVADPTKVAACWPMAAPA